jgi:hypothetical protein
MFHRPRISNRPNKRIRYQRLMLLLILGEDARDNGKVVVDGLRLEEERGVHGLADLLERSSRPRLGLLE